MIDRAFFEKQERDILCAPRRAQLGFPGAAASRTRASRLKQFLFENLYRHYRVVRMAEKAKRVIGDLFAGYVANPRQLPPHVSTRIDDDGLDRVVCDYIAGMTDRFALDEHKRLFDPHVRL